LVCAIVIRPFQLPEEPVAPAISSALLSSVGSQQCAPVAYTLSRTPKSSGKGAAIVNYRDNLSQYHELLWYPDGTTSIFDAPGYAWTIPNAVSSKGEMVGQVLDGVGYHGFVRIH
jgi:hypothetical protein